MGDNLELVSAAPIALRSAPLREIEARLFEYGVPGHTAEGLELIERGALEGIDPASVVLTLDHADPAIGRATALEDRDDGPYGIFRVAPTARGDEALALASPGADGSPPIYGHVSVAFVREAPAEVRTIEGRRVNVRKRLDLRAVGLTYRPAHSGANIVAIRSNEGGNVIEATELEGQATEPRITASGGTATTEARMIAATEQLERFLSTQLEERRRDFTLPPARAELSLDKGKWASAALRLITGERVPDVELRALADVITTDNAGVVPTQIRSELIGFINPARPFLASTREVPAGDSGLELQFPRLVQRPLVGLQTAEKAELPSRKTIIDAVSFTAKTKGGAGDISMQLLKRSSPSFLNLWLELLAEAYAVDTENEAVDALLAEAAVVEGGIFDIDSPSFGGAFTNAAAVSPLLMPDRIWLSTAAVAAMIDAKTPAGGGGTPAYPGLATISGLGASGDSSGLGFRLTPVHVPALDDEAPDIIVGPSKGFAWAEDGTYTLQADVPAKFGRDIGIAGMVWFMPIYPAAFTSYTLS